MSEKKFVTYEQFGAIGDGKNNDFPAIFAAHNYANENGLAVNTVIASPAVIMCFNYHCVATVTKLGDNGHTVT